MQEINESDMRGKETFFIWLVRGRPLVKRGCFQQKNEEGEGAGHAEHQKSSSQRAQVLGTKAGKAWRAGPTLTTPRRQSPPLLSPQRQPRLPPQRLLCLIIVCCQVRLPCQSHDLQHACRHTVLCNLFYVNVCWLNKEKQVFCRSYELSTSLSIL